jgi:hypothetical protein
MCWLCTYQGEPLSVRLNEFVIQNIGFMDLTCIAQQLSDGLLLQSPHATHADMQTMRIHITEHMLHPRVRIAVLLRQLLELSSLLQNNIVVHDNGVTTVDKSNAELYLKVIGQIMTMYKADTQGMLFVDDTTTKKVANA